MRRFLLVSPAIHHRFAALCSIFYPIHRNVLELFSFVQQLYSIETVNH